MTGRTGSGARSSLSPAAGAPETIYISGFPPDVTWWYGVLHPEDWARVLHIDDGYWLALSGGTRRPSEVLRTLVRGAMPEWLIDLGVDHRREFRNKMHGGLQLPDVILVSTPRRDKLVVLEGHARVTGWFLAGQGTRTRPAYLGTSPAMAEWGCF